MIIPCDNIVRATIIMNCQMHMYTCIYIYIYKVYICIECSFVWDKYMYEEASASDY